MQELKDKVVILTGASQGLGAVMAWALADAGATLILTARNEAKLAETLQRLPPGHRAYTLRCDVTAAGDRAALVERVPKEQGRVDVLINNAGVEDLGVFAEQ